MNKQQMKDSYLKWANEFAVKNDRAPYTYEIVDYCLQKQDQLLTELEEEVRHLRGQPSDRDSFDYDLGQVDAYKKVLSLINKYK